MLSGFRYLAAAVLFGVGLAGCGAGSQSGLNPSGASQTIQRPVRSASVHKNTVGFTWSHDTIPPIPAGQKVYTSQACSSGTVINGGWKDTGSGPDIIALDSFPDPPTSSWNFGLKNQGNHAESVDIYILCATGS